MSDAKQEAIRQFRVLMYRSVAGEHLQAELHAQKAVLAQHGVSEAEVTNIIHEYRKPSSGSYRKQEAVLNTPLNVPFDEKDQAKAVGARWDAARKHWYAPAGSDLNKFRRWT